MIVTSTPMRKSKPLVFVTSSMAPHTKAFAETRKTSPSGAPAGISASTGRRQSGLRPRKTPAATPDARPLPPPPRFTSDCTRTALPPCAPKSEQSTLPRPWPKHSRRMGVAALPVTWSTRDCVMRLSRRPTMASRTPTAIAFSHMTWLCHCTPEGGKSQAGTAPHPPRRACAPRTSFMDLRGRLRRKRKSTAEATAMAARGAGRTLHAAGILHHAKAATTAATAVMSMLHRVPWTQCPSPPLWKGWACQQRVMSARPLTKPATTWCGMSVMKRESLK
mmetsp:Transcript_6544/g.20201  ORF Transcript_6544/g.20201 Transcript_6544/m.20201 type:complete len:277 (-) Transcript_6544:417-1247(-)